MTMQTYNETVAWASTSGSALGNSITPASILPPGARWPIPANMRQGQIIKVVASGRVSNIVTTPGTLLLELRAGSDIIASGGAMALNTVAKSNVSWWLEWLLTCQSTSATANFTHQGRWTSESVIGSPLPSVGGAGTHMLPASTPGVGASTDLTAGKMLDLFATWSIANVGNTITLHQCAIFLCN